MEDENNEGNEAEQSAEDLAAQQADEAAAQGSDGVDNGEGADGDDGEGDGGEGNDQPDPDKPVEKAALPKGVQKRIDKITRQKYDAERQIQDLQHQLANRPEAQPANTERPTLEQFDFDDGKFIEALTDWKVGEAIKSQGQNNAAQQQRARQDEVLQEFESKKQVTTINGITKYEDYEDVVTNNDDVSITPQMADIITDSEIGHDIAYHLCSNPTEADKIARLTPLKQAAAVARLEAQLASKPTNKLTKATKPVKPVGGKGSTTHKLDPVKDWAKWAEERNKAGL